MKLRIYFCVYFLVFLSAFAQGLARASEYSSKAQVIVATKPKTSAEKAILNTVEKTYKFSGRDYVCIWGAKKLKGDFVKKFSPYFSEQIIENYFREHKACDLVASARYGFLPLDNPDNWSDKQYELVRIETVEVLADTALVEVRFWTNVEKNKKLVDQPHGGTIVYLSRISEKWKIANFEGTDWLGADGFHSLIEDYPSVATPDWKNMDYRKSLIHPEPFK